ncbi:MAG TPA: hypothetical protein VFC04_08870, partial [Actinomycetota bacterium]|nr:hypothetical protein [Actinomycetota bacterium]
MSGRTRRIVAALAGAALFGAGALSASLLDRGARASGAEAPAAGALPGFSKVVFLSHLNDPKTTPGFPGDTAFVTSVAFTVPAD